jgi:hypothetical protein
MRLFFGILTILLMTNDLSAQQYGQVREMDVLSYVFEIELNDSTDVLYGTATAELILQKPTPTFSFDLIKKGPEELTGMRVTRVFVDGLPACFHFDDDDRIYVQNNTQNWPADRILQTRIEYFGIPADGLIIGSNKFGSRSFFGDNWPNRARHWLPVVDHPSDKARVSFILTIPEHYEVIASGRMTTSERLPGNRTRYRFETERELATKVMVLAASDFIITTYDTLYDIPISSWIFEGNITGEMDYLPSVEALRFFSEKIGPYTFQKLANVQSKTRYGGMENAGNIFYYENSVNGKAQVEDLVVHEVAHQWFGNAVTEKEWADIWLSEGFATYLTHLFIQEKYGDHVFRKGMEKDRNKVLRFGRDFPALVVDTTVTDLMYYLNPNSYQKGSWVLHMLRIKLGDELFFRILRNFYNRFKDGNAGTMDFITLAEEVSGVELSAFFRQWLYYPVNPELQMSWFREEDHYFLKVQQKQSGDYLFDLDLEIKIGNEQFFLPVRKRESIYSLVCSKRLPPEPDPEIHLLFAGSVYEAVFPVDTTRVISVSPQVKRAILPRKIGRFQADLLKPGELLFQDLDCGPLCDAIESVTDGYRGSAFSHVAQIIRVEDHQAELVEAIGGEVKRSLLADFLSRSLDENGDPKVIVGRLIDRDVAGRSVDLVQGYLGKKYDDLFSLENDRYYCSELVYFSCLNEDQPVFSLNPMTFKQAQSGEFDPVWVDYFREMGAAIPEGEPGLNPGSISRSPAVEMIYRFGNPDGFQGN